MIFYDGLKVPREKLITHLQELEDRLGDLSKVQVPCRRFRLPISFESKEQDEAIARYMETQRPQAPYLPDNLGFVARNNAFTPEHLKSIYLTGTFMAVAVGFLCGNATCLPVDPRNRMSCPKQNPSRVFTPAGTVSWGGSCLSIYPVDSPGGYQMTGRTLPCFDMLGSKAGFSQEKPWLFEDFDLISYYAVSETELAERFARYECGNYEWEWEATVFDMGEHNRLLVETEAEVRKIRQRQAVAQEEMTKAEAESLRKWREDKEKFKVDESTVDALLTGRFPHQQQHSNAAVLSLLRRRYSPVDKRDPPDPAISTIEAPVDANVWKVLIEQGQELSPNQTIAILEAMKLEINVNTPDDQEPVTVEKLLVTAGVRISSVSV